MLCIVLAIMSYVYLITSDIYGLHIFKNRNIFYGIPALVLVAALLSLEKDLTDNKFIRFFVKLGEASYAIYLFHYYIVVFFSRIIFVKLLGDNTNSTVEIIKIVITMTVTVIVSIIIYEVVDKPIQNYLRKIMKRKGNKNEEYKI
jgi:peptidoglycan/LPS O-acetylase OafA/YrhL